VFEDMPGPPGDRPEAARRRFAAELAKAVLRAEKRLGHAVDRAELAKRLNVSTGSVYAYLNGTTLPRSRLLDRLLTELGVTGPEIGRLGTLRDAVEVAQRLRRAAAPESDDSVLTGLPRPRQLPAPAAHFGGREASLGELDRLLGADPAGPPASDGLGPDETADSAVRASIVVIGGTAGVGKTTLALSWAHRIKDRFPDGQLYVNLRGFDLQAPLDPDEALHGLLHALGVQPAAIPAGLDAKSALLRSLSDRRRMLLLADNARSADHVRPLLPGSPGCLTIVTSRDRLDGLAIREGAVGITLDVLSHEEAVALLGRRIGPGRLAREPQAAAELAELCARLPLALSVAAARVAAGPGQRIGPLVAELRKVHDRLDLLGQSDADVDLRTVLDWSYTELPEDASRLLRLLGAHPGPDIDGYASAALLGTPAPPRGLLNTLTAAHLISERTPGRFGFHDLLRLYAGDLADQDDETERRTAMARVLEYYLTTATLAHDFIQPSRADRPPGDRDPSQPPLGDYAHAMEWFADEFATLQSVIKQAAEHGFESYAWQLASVLTVFMRRTGRREQRVLVHQTALEAAARGSDRAAHATSLRLLADALARVNRRQEALGMLAESMAECRELGDDDGALEAHLSFVRVLDSLGDYRPALEHARSALVLAEQGSDSLLGADALTAVAKQLARLGEHTEALGFGRRALAGYSGLSHPEGEADILLSIAGSEVALGEYDLAIADYERSLELDRLLGDRYWEAHALARSAEAHQLRGDHARARARRAEAITVLESLHHPDVDEVRSRLGSAIASPESSDS
jgi:tetratricopeptide (TPR) repeat protein/transcriptional regulator with XRE-family HTH domain